LSRGYIRFAGSIDYRLSTINSPLRVETRWAALNDLLTDDNLRVALAVRYAFPIKGRFSWFVEPVASMDYYTKTTRHSWQVAFQTGLTF
jgi:hypothetical protein